GGGLGAVDAGVRAEVVPVYDALVEALGLQPRDRVGLRVTAGRAHLGRAGRGVQRLGDHAPAQRRARPERAALVDGEHALGLGPQHRLVVRVIGLHVLERRARGDLHLGTARQLVQGRGEGDAVRGAGGTEGAVLPTGDDAAAGRPHDLVV